MIFPILYKKTSVGKIQQWSIEIEDNKYRTTSGQKDGKLTTANWTICNPKNIGKINETSANEQVIAEAKALWQKQINKGYFEDLSDINTEKFFKPMLAKNYEDYKDDLPEKVYIQPKLDGIRCIAKNDGLWTRNGKLIVSAPHIHEYLKPFFAKNPNLIFDGELYCDKYSNDFNKICSLIRKTKPTQEDLEESKNAITYHVYDFPSIKSNFYDRWLQLKEFIDNQKLIHVITEEIDKKDIENVHAKYVELGYEGAIIRLNTPYENKRTKNLLKLKSFQDDEFLIIDVIEGEGNRSGGAGYIIAQTKDKNIFRSNIKGTREYCTELLINKKEIIGKLGTIKFFNYTPYMIPRFPYLITIRDYE